MSTRGEELADAWKLIEDIRAGRDLEMSSELTALVEDVCSTPCGLNDENAMEWAMRLATGTIDGE